VRPDLDSWVDDPAVRVCHRREAAVTAAELWAAARTVRIADTRVLGRLLRWRIPGTPASIPYDELFRQPPFAVLHEDEGMLVSGLVGRIWTLRRDYPTIAGPDEFRSWSAPGTACVVFANWVEPAGSNRAALLSETRVRATDRDGRVGLTAVRPLITAFNSLIGREALDLAVTRAEGTRFCTTSGRHDTR
jgi:hypothetical protein